MMGSQRNELATEVIAIDTHSLENDTLICKVA